MPLALGIGSPLAAPVLQRPTRSAETRAIAAKMRALASPMSYAREQAFDEILVRPLTDAGLWAKLDCLYIPQHSGAASLVNLVAPAGAVATPNNSTTIVADRYFASDGVSAYFASNVTLDGAGKYKQNDASMWCYSVTDATGTPIDIGVNTVARVNGRNGGLLVCRTNTASDGSHAVADSLGLYGWSRDASDHVDLFKDGAIIASPSVASTGTPNSGLRFCGGISSTYSTRRLAAVGAGGSLTSGEIGDLDTIISAWLTHIGAI